jgi:transcriptional regulator with XRE-family HTH domain
MDINEKIGYRLKIARQQNELTNKEVSEKLYISPTHLSNMESGKRKVSLENLIMFSKLYNKDVVYFLSDFK